MAYGPQVDDDELKDLLSEAKTDIAPGKGRSKRQAALNSGLARAEPSASSSSAAAAAAEEDDGDEAEFEF